MHLDREGSVLIDGEKHFVRLKVRQNGMNPIEFLGVGWVCGCQDHASFAPAVTRSSGYASDDLGACAISGLAQNFSEQWHRPSRPINAVVTRGLMKNVS